jgi:hypothetical protein
MRRFVSIVALLLLFAGAAPLLACLTNPAMSHGESACCRAMHDKCGAMATMGCCRTETQTDEYPQMAPKSAVDPHVDVVTPLGATVIAPRMAAPFFLEAPREYWPPGLLTASTIVLRI